MRINVRSDVNKTIRANAHLRDQLLKAAAKAVNDTAGKVRAAAIDEVTTRNQDFSKATVRGYITVRRAAYRAQQSTRSGQLRKNYGGITAAVVAAGRAPNLIYFVPSAARTPEAWRGGSGVAAHVAGRTTVYDGTFIVRTKSGKMIVVTRSAKAKRSPHLMRPRGNKGKWLRGWSKGIYGPGLQQLAATDQTLEVMRTVARQQWPAMWKKYSAVVINEAS